MSIFRCSCFENIPPSTPNECDMPLSIIVLSFDCLSLCIPSRGFVVYHITANYLSSRHLQIERFWLRAHRLRQSIYAPSAIASR